ncbi:hypothetical protein BJX99DRAFT_149293 [Aspergillus californicus]
MCHRISWYHVLCLHIDHASTAHICCSATLNFNHDCDILETLSLPMLGACTLCRIKASFAENLSTKSQPPYAITPIMESFEDEALVKSDDAYFSRTHSEVSNDDQELVDRVTF